MQAWLIPLSSMNMLLFVLLAAVASGAPADLFAPVKHNDIAAIRKAVHAGADVNARDGGGATALMYAAVYSTPESMRLLIKSGADVNAKNKVNATALMWAIGDIEKVRLLLRHGADVNSKSDAGKTPLLLALRLMGAGHRCKTSDRQGRGYQSSGEKRNDCVDVGRGHGKYGNGQDAAGRWGF